MIGISKWFCINDDIFFLVRMEGDRPRGKGRDYLYDDYKELKEANKLLTRNEIPSKTTMF